MLKHVLEDTKKWLNRIELLFEYCGFICGNKFNSMPNYDKWVFKLKAIYCKKKQIF